MPGSSQPGPAHRSQDPPLAPQRPRPLGEQRLVARHRHRLAPSCHPARRAPPASSERLTWAACCPVGALVGLSAVPPVLLLPAESTRPLLRSLLAFVAPGLALIVGSWLWDHRPHG